MRNILITGGCGFIGSNFINYILKKYVWHKWKVVYFYKYWIIVVVFYLYFCNIIHSSYSELWIISLLSLISLVSLISPKLPPPFSQKSTYSFSGIKLKIIKSIFSTSTTFFKTSPKTNYTRIHQNDFPNFPTIFATLNRRFANHCIMQSYVVNDSCISIP